MNKQQLVTRRQAIKLKQLGFHDKTCAYTCENAQDSIIRLGMAWDYNKRVINAATGKKGKPFISIPTVYEAFDWLVKRVKGHYFEIAWLEEQKYIAKNKYVRYRKAINMLIEAYEKDQNQYS